MTISQTEARRLRKEVKRLQGILQSQRRRWSEEYPGGFPIATYNGWGGDALVPVAVKTARALGHAVVVQCDTNGDLTFIGLPHPSVTP